MSTSTVLQTSHKIMHQTSLKIRHSFELLRVFYQKLSLYKETRPNRLLFSLWPLYTDNFGFKGETSIQFYSQVLYSMCLLYSSLTLIVDEIVMR